MFDHLITPAFKNIYKEAIDTLIVNSTNSLTVPCKFIYDSVERQLCPNCVFDPIQQRSLNKYNGNGPAPFPDQSICPVCAGYGFSNLRNEETAHMAVIFDSKYWMNWGSNSVNITEGMVQSLSTIKLFNQIKNCREMIMDTNLSHLGNYNYTRAGEPEPAGLGDHIYLITMWKRL